MILRCADAPGVLELDAEANLTHDELLQALPADESRLVVHEICFATPEGARRKERLLIFWTPPDAGGQEEAYTAGCTALKEFLTDIHVHLTARQTDQLAYRGSPPWPAEADHCRGRLPSTPAAAVQRSRAATARTRRGRARRIPRADRGRAPTSTTPHSVRGGNTSLSRGGREEPCRGRRRRSLPAPGRSARRTPRRTRLPRTREWHRRALRRPGRTVRIRTPAVG